MRPVKPVASTFPRPAAIAWLVVLALALVLGIVIQEWAHPAEATLDCTVLRAEAIRATETARDIHQVWLWHRTGWPAGPEAWATWNRVNHDPVMALSDQPEKWDTAWVRLHDLAVTVLREC